MRSASDRRRLLTGCALAAPTILTVLLVSSVELSRLRQPATAIERTPFAFTLAEAIARDDVVRAYEFIRQGQDPNDLIPVRDANLTADRQLLVAPILWAVAHDSRRALQMLIGHGARPDESTLDRAMCLAQHFGYESATRLLSAQGGRQVTPCRAGGEAPLLAMLGQ